MELRVFDKTVQPLGAIDELASLLWHTKYFDVGTFSLLAPITDNNSRLLVEGNLITKHDGKKEVKTADGGVWRRAAQITYVHITKDENGLEQLEAQGYMLSWWLNKLHKCTVYINVAEIVGFYAVPYQLSALAAVLRVNLYHVARFHSGVNLYKFLGIHIKQYRV